MTTAQGTDDLDVYDTTVPQGKGGEERPTSDAA
jgi:hypothetical protein